MSDHQRQRILSNRVKNLWGSRLILWQENRHIIKTTLCIFAPAPFAGFTRRCRTPYGYSKYYNYVNKTRRRWFKVYTFLKAN